MCRLSWNTLEVTALFLWDNRAIFKYNKQNNTWMLGNMKLFLVLNRISHSFALFNREISWSTLEINFILPHIHVLFSIYDIDKSIFTENANTCRIHVTTSMNRVAYFWYVKLASGACISRKTFTTVYLESSSLDYWHTERHGDNGVYTFTIDDKESFLDSFLDSFFSSSFVKLSRNFWTRSYNIHRINVRCLNFKCTVKNNEVEVKLQRCLLTRNTTYNPQKSTFILLYSGTSNHRIDINQNRITE